MNALARAAIAAACVVLSACVTSSYDQAYEKAYVSVPSDDDYRGVVLFLHGCGGRNPYGDWRDYFVKKGFVFIYPYSFDDPRPPKACSPPWANQSAIRFIRKRQAEYALEQIRLDYPGKPIIIWGHSEGGGLANTLPMDGVAGVITTGQLCGGWYGNTTVPKDVPLLVMVGDRDRYMKPPLRTRNLNVAGDCAAMMARSPKWNYLMVKDSGHWVSMIRREAREAVVRLLGE